MHSVMLDSDSIITFGINQSLAGTGIEKKPKGPESKLKSDFRFFFPGIGIRIKMSPESSITECTVINSGDIFKAVLIAARIVRKESVGDHG